ncbi:hypothetical protein ACHAPT_001173 [Fusarium lateritium]
MASARKISGLEAHTDIHHRYHFKKADESTSDLSITIPGHHKSRRDLDDSISKVTNILEQVRNEMNIMAADGPLSTDDLGDLVEEARTLVKGALFIITRYYHDKEEGLRTSQQRKYAALAQEGRRHGCVVYHLQHALITLRYDFKARASQLLASKDSRMTKLQDALHKVEVQKLALVAQGGTAPY